MRTYCTLFDHAYLSRGLAMYESLIKNEEEAYIYILAMDNICYYKLRELRLDHAEIISLAQFESRLLKQLKKERGWAEYCWTCTSFLIEYILTKYEVSMCTYLDSDIFFFQSPEVIFKEMGDASVLITPHNFQKYSNLEATSGRYCVQFLPFRNDERGRKVLGNWKEKCIACCELAPEKGHCGDQKYLDEWMKDFDGVCESRGLGIGVAPWNAERFSVYLNEGKLVIFEKNLQIEHPLVFYHFHGLKFFDCNIVRLTDAFYELGKDMVENIYAKYVKKIDEIHKKYDLGEKENYDGILQKQIAAWGMPDKNDYKRNSLIEIARGVR